MTDEDEAWFVSSFARGLKVIRAFGKGRRLMKLSEVAREADMSRAAARRFLKTLEALGYAGVEGERYFLTVRVLDLGYSFVSSMELSERAQPILSELAQAAQGSASLGVLDQGEVIFLARSMVEQRFRLLASIGTRHPAYALALGRAILANLPDDLLEQYLDRVELQKFTEKTITDKAELRRVLKREREKGWSGCMNESVVGIVAIAVPIFDSGGHVRCSVNLNVPGVETPAQIKESHLPALLEAARRLERALQPELIPVTV